MCRPADPRGEFLILRTADSTFILRCSHHNCAANNWSLLPRDLWLILISPCSHLTYCTVIKMPRQDDEVVHLIFKGLHKAAHISCCMGTSILHVWWKLDTVLEWPTFIPMKLTRWHMNPGNIWHVGMKLSKCSVHPPLCVERVDWWLPLAELANLWFNPLLNEWGNIISISALVHQWCDIVDHPLTKGFSFYLPVSIASGYMLGTLDTT